MTKPKPKRSTQGKGRFSARKKAEAVRRLVAGEDLDVLGLDRGLAPTNICVSGVASRYHQLGAEVSAPGDGSLP